MPQSSDDFDLLLVGAGISGLQAAVEARALGLKVKILERDPMPGGKWSGHGIYDCVQIQQHKEDFFLPGMPWPEGTPSFATRDDMVSATGKYIDEHGLAELIECRSEVTACVFDEAAGAWTVRTAAGTEWKARYLAWAVGTLGPPNFPKQVTDALAKFKGDVVHSHSYYRPLPYEGQHVVVLGYGASSVEIAQDLARNGKCASVKLVAPPKVQADGQRFGQDWCLSRVLPGQGSRFCSQGQGGEGGTLEARNEMVRAAMKETYPKYPECLPPKLRPSGTLDGVPIYPGMDGRPLGGRVIVSEGFLECVSDGRVTCHPGYLGGSDASHVTVTCKGEKDVSLRCDAVVVCTGYEPPTGRIAKTMTPAPKSCETLYKALWMADVPNAALIGHVYGFVAVPPFAGLQAKYLARVVSGAEALPPREEMLSWVATYESKYTVTQRLTENPYFRELRQAALGGALGAKAPEIGAGPPPESLPSPKPAPRPRRRVAPRARARHPAKALTAAGVAAAAAGVALASGAVGLTIFGAAALTVRKAAGGGGGGGDDTIVTAAGEALTYLAEARGREIGGGGIHALVVGGGDATAASDAKLAGVIADQLRPAERSRFTHAAVAYDASGAAWGGVAAASADLVICNGPLSGAAPSAPCVAAVIRALKPGGHAVLMLDETCAHRAGWLALFDAREAASPYEWRMMHKTWPRPKNGGGGSGATYRQFVYRRAPARG